MDNPILMVQFDKLQENIELTKEVQDLKIQIENVQYLKSQIGGQLEDARRRLEDDERVSTQPTIYYLIIEFLNFPEVCSFNS